MSVPLLLLWAVGEVILLVYVFVFVKVPDELITPTVPETQSKIDQTEIVPHQTIQADVAKKHTERAA